MRSKNPELYDEILYKLQNYQIRPLPGINTIAKLECFVSQTIASVRRIEVALIYKNREHSPLCADPSNIAFDPLKAASWHKRQGNVNEAFWLVFLATNFGRNRVTKWNLVKEVYSGRTNSVMWSWEEVCRNISGFRDWLESNRETIKQNGKVGNHRKYHRVDGYSRLGTGAAVQSYIEWIGETNNHEDLMNTTLQGVNNNQKLAFRSLYNSMSCVKGFGRMGKFDYLTMVGKLGLVDILPDSTYMNGATGPFIGGRILFGQSVNHRVLDSYFSELDELLMLPFGMQVIEDAVCNWQKNPTQYKHFGG